MDASATTSKALYLVCLLLVTFNLLDSQGEGDVWFSLNGTTYHNNSCVTLEDIGEGNDTALLCRTKQSACCTSNFTGNGSALGGWSFPNGTRISNNASSNQQTDIYITRGHMVVRMHRRRGGVEGIYRCDIPDSMTKTIYIGVYSTRSSTVSTSESTLPPTDGTTGTPETVPVSSSTQPTKTVGATATTRTVPVSSSTQPTKTVGATATTRTVPVSSSTQPTKTVGATVTTGTVPVSSTTQPTKTVGATATTRTVPVSSSTQSTKTVGATGTTGTVPVRSSTQPTNNPPSDGSTITSVIIVVAVMIILVVIVVGVVILVVLFRAKKRKQQLEVNKLQNVTEDMEMKLKQEGIEKEADHPPYTIIQTKAPPNVPSKSEELVDYLNRSSTLPGEYSEIELVQDDSQHVLPAKPPRRMNYSDPMSKDTESNPVYHDVDQHCDPSTTKNVRQGNDIYTVPDSTSSYTVETSSQTYETVYSEPIQPSLFTDADRTTSDSHNVQPYRHGE